VRGCWPGEGRGREVSQKDVDGEACCEAVAEGADVGGPGCDGVGLGDEGGWEDVFV
jgi:hypothetical protein